MKVSPLFCRAALALVALANCLCSMGADNSWPKADPAALARWQAMRFGMFIHWGPVSLTGHEIGWSRGTQTPIETYDNLYRQFNPTNFNAAQWVSVAKAAGMKYVVLTTKHHDGFCLWDTRQTDFNIMHSPFGRDVVKELSAACRQQGIAFGTYYSTCDWHHPDFPLTSPGGSVKRPQYNLDAYNNYLLAQVSELITNYGPLVVLWADVPQMFEGRGAKTIRLARSLQPDILINDRTGDGGDYSTPEQQVGAYQDQRPWETCMTICNQWAWKSNDEMKSLKQCLQTLVACAGGDGNLLFNVGPMPDGRIEQRQIDRLREMGQWLEKNGTSIYKTRGGPWKPGKGLYSTRRDNSVFLHLLRDPGERLEIAALPRPIQSARILGGGAVEFAVADGKLALTLPASARDPIDTIVQLEFDGPVMDLKAIPPGISSKNKIEASNTYQNDEEQYGPQQLFDGDPHTRWATDFGTHEAWVSWDAGKASTVQRIRIDEAIEKRVKAFEFQYRNGQTWTTVFTGKTIGPAFEQTFPAISAREFRLNILEASEGPTLNNIELLEK